MFNVLHKLIEKKFYKTKAEALQKIDVFYACNRITDDEYIELSAYAEEVYVEE